MLTESNKSSEQPWAHSREVVLQTRLSVYSLADLTTRAYLGLESVQRQAQENTEGDKQCLQHNYVVVEGGDDPKSESLHGRESAQEDQVERMTMALPE